MIYGHQIRLVASQKAIGRCAHFNVKLLHLIGYDKEKKFQSHPLEKNFKRPSQKKKISKGFREEKKICV